MKTTSIILLTFVTLLISSCETLNNQNNGTQRAALRQQMLQQNEMEIKIAQQRAREANFRKTAIPKISDGDLIISEELWNNLGKGIKNSLNSSYDVRVIQYDYEEMQASVPVTYTWLRSTSKPVKIVGTIYYQSNRVWFILDYAEGTRRKDNEYIQSLRKGMYLL